MRSNILPEFPTVGKRVHEVTIAFVDRHGKAVCVAWQTAAAVCVVVSRVGESVLRVRNVPRSRIGASQLVKILKPLCIFTRGKFFSHNFHLRRLSRFSRQTCEFFGNFGEFFKSPCHDLTLSFLLICFDFKAQAFG